MYIHGCWIIDLECKENQLRVIVSCENINIIERIAKLMLVNSIIAAYVRVDYVDSIQSG